MAIKTLDINGLFGRVDYHLDFKDKNISIITGPNGYGKTMILKIINYIFKNDFRELQKIKFSSIKMELLNESSIYINKFDDKMEFIGVNELEGFTVRDILYSNEPRDISDDDFFFVNNDGEKIKVELIKNKRANTTGFPQRHFEKLLKNTNVTFIKAQRLQDSDAKNIKINQLASDLVKKINAASQEASLISQKLDSSFPTRLMERISFGFTSSRFSSIRERLYGLNEVMNRYAEYDLVNSEHNLYSNIVLTTELSIQYSEVLNLYVDDALQKVEPYNDIFRKIDLFVSLIKDNMLAFKEIKVNRDKGFYFVGDLNNEEIELSSLSSGEQNQIIIYYDMIFNSDRDSMILIDEPEISLHVAWQKSFLQYIDTIMELNEPSKIIVATHSPSIVNSSWEFVIDLMSAGN